MKKECNLKSPIHRIRHTRTLRKCEECGEFFEARTSVTRFCSKNCNNHYANRHKKRLAAKISSQSKGIKQTSTLSLKAIISPEIRQESSCSALTSDLLSIKNFAARLGVCKQTVYNMIAQGAIRQICFSTRLSYISWAEFMTTIENKSKHKLPFHKDLQKKSPSDIVKIIDHTVAPFEEWIDVPNACKRYNFAQAALYNYVKKYNIPKLKKGRMVLYSRASLDIIRKKQMTVPNGYVTVSEIQEKYGLQRSYVYIINKRHQIPSVRVGRKLFVCEESFAKTQDQRISS